MLSMLKLLIITSILVLSANAKTTDQRVESFEKRRITSNPKVKLESLKLVLKKEVEDGWYGYVYDISLTLNDKKITIKDTIFSNGKMITAELKSLKTSFPFKRLMHPTLDNKYYQKSHLIAGNQNAKHKLVIFSDPLCPNCTMTVPELIKDAQQNPTILALYYVSLPLDMHPTAKVLAKATHLAKIRGVENAYYKAYTANFDKYFDPYESKDNQKALDTFNKILKTNIKMYELNSKELNKHEKHDLELSSKALIAGTPTLFLDGEVDVTRSKYKKLIK